MIRKLINYFLEIFFFQNSSRTTSLRKVKSNYFYIMILKLSLPKYVKKIERKNMLNFFKKNEYCTEMNSLKNSWVLEKKKYIIHFIPLNLF